MAILGRLAWVKIAEKPSWDMKKNPDEAKMKQSQSDGRIGQEPLKKGKGEVDAAYQRFLPEGEIST